MSEPADYSAIVCSACLRASCWHGEFMCERSRSVGIKAMRASALRALDREDPSHYSRERVEEVTGVRP